jgi:hypothetical protein
MDKFCSMQAEPRSQKNRERDKLNKRKRDKTFRCVPGCLALAVSPIARAHSSQTTTRIGGYGYSGLIVAPCCRQTATTEQLELHRQRDALRKLCAACLCDPACMPVSSLLPAMTVECACLPPRYGRLRTAVEIGDLDTVVWLIERKGAD